MGVAILTGDERECDRERGRWRARLEDGSITGRRVESENGRLISMKRAEEYGLKEEIYRRRGGGEKREKRKMKLLADGAIN